MRKRLTTRDNHSRNAALCESWNNHVANEVVGHISATPCCRDKAMYAVQVTAFCDLQNSLAVWRLRKRGKEARRREIIKNQVLGQQLRRMCDVHDRPQLGRVFRAVGKRRHDCQESSTATKGHVRNRK